MKFASTIFISILMVTSSIHATSPPQNTIQGIVNAIKSMDSKKLAGYFASTVDLEVDDKNGSYSHTQSEIIFRDFFKKHTLKSFNLNHQGSSNDGSEYFIGTYKTTSKEFRVYVLLKKQDELLKIQQIQFEGE